MIIPFVGPSYSGTSLNINAQQAINWYVEKDATGKNIISLLPTPGTKLFANYGALSTRGMHVFNGLLYLVSGNLVYSVNPAGTIIFIGTLLTASGRVSMADNGLSPTGGNQLMIVDGTAGYIYNSGTGVFARITDINFPSTGADMVTFIDGYFIVNIGGGSSSFQVSNFYDGSTWNALNKSTADADPDLLLAVASTHRDLWLLGEYTTEVWYDSGQGNPPFARYPSTLIEHGIAAKWSIAVGDSTLFWLAQSRQGKGYVVKSVGYNVQTISTPAIDDQISTYQNISDAFGYVYTQAGHTFYVLTFPSADATWVYDVTTDMWHQRSTYQGDFYGIHRHIGNCYANYMGKHLIGDYIDGDIYQMDENVYTDNGQPIVRVRTTQHLSKDMKTVFIRRLQVDIETGVGDVTGIDPQVMLSWSDDGAHTWS
ncbi:MAG: hypothetical protein KGJ01_03330, partial [Patescibacteria group bacterium]|nr:hypothetical protein [Patescibacteria group bacterium]